MPEREETTKRQRDDAESLARLIQIKCKHVEGGTCLECLKDGLSQDAARRERLRAEWDERMKPKAGAETRPLSRRVVWLARIGCVAVLGIPVGWWVLGSWMEASTYTRLTGKPVSTWEAMWVELRVQEPTRGD